VSIGKEKQCGRKSVANVATLIDGNCAAVRGIKKTAL
jgi:hypothetical protein